MSAANYLAAVDAGTCMTRVLLAQMTDRGPRLLASGTAPAHGMKKGAVTDSAAAAVSVRAALDQAEAAAGRKAQMAVVSISGRHIACFTGSGVIALKGRTIMPEDRDRAVDAAMAHYVPLDREVLHVMQSGFSVDSGPRMADPVGLDGTRLEAGVCVITAETRMVGNLKTACEAAGVGVMAAVFSPAAAALAALTTDEREHGSVLIDIGGGTTDMALFQHGGLASAAVIGIGGLHITNDLAVCLNLDAETAERIKMSAGAPQGSASARVNGRQAAAVIRARCEELFEMVRKELRRATGASVRTAVITGGTALLQDITPLAATILGIPVRVGMPQGVAGSTPSLRDPAFAVSMGLLLHGGRVGLFAAPETAGNVVGRVKERVRDLTGYKDFLEILQKKKKGVSYV